MLLLAIDRRNGQVARKIRAKSADELWLQLPMSYQNGQYKIVVKGGLR